MTTCVDFQVALLRLALQNPHADLTRLAEIIGEIEGAGFQVVGLYLAGESGCDPANDNRPHD